MPDLSFHHLHHEAADVDAAAAFYVDCLSGELTERFERDGVQWARVSVGGVMLNITDRADAALSLGLYRGLDHVGIHTSDFEATTAHLRTKGVKFFIEPHSPTPGVQVAFISGPDNVKIEILQVDPT